MRPISWTAIALLPLLLLGATQSQAASGFQLPTGTTVRVSLQKPLDSHKDKPGDPVIAKSVENVKSDGRTVLPRGTKIIGHLTAVRPHSKEEPQAVLAIIFDHAVLKKGEEVPLRLVIQAVAPGQQNEIPTMSMTPATAAGSGGGFGPVTGPLTAGPNSDPHAGTPGHVASPESPEQSPEDNISARGELTPTCHGVLRIDGVALAREDLALGSIIFSQKRNIQLDIGTQMMLRVPGN